MTYLRGQRWRFAVALLGVTMGVCLTVARPPGTLTTPSAAATATGRSLDRKLPELNWAQTSLDSALNAIELGSGATIKYDVDALRESSIKPSQLTVTARLRDTRARKALDVALEAASPQISFRHFIDDDGTIIVTTPRGDAKRTLTRKYHVWDLLLPQEERPLKREDEMQLNMDVAQLVTEAIEPESWVEAGGEIGSISIDNGVMTVRQTPENLRMVEGLLRQLGEGIEPERLRRRVQEGAR
jgi:hypothetical protein